MTFTKGKCIVCKRGMYQMPASRGQASEWRHESSAHPISWTPDKHIAGPHEVYEHQHRWSPPVDEVQSCEVVGCDATMLVFIRTEPNKKNMSYQEKRDAESRKRGSQNSRKSDKKPKAKQATPS